MEQGGKMERIGGKGDGEGKGEGVGLSQDKLEAKVEVTEVKTSNEPVT